jgi:hypothetical protein
MAERVARGALAARGALVVATVREAAGAIARRIPIAIMVRTAGMATAVAAVVATVAVAAAAMEVAIDPW